MRISVLVPTLDEAAGIEAVLESVKRELAVGDELIVIDGGSRDGTARIAARLADKVLVSPPGRAGQMQAGALVAAGDVLLFLHADTFLPEGWRGQLSAVWDGPRPPAVTAFCLGFDAPGAHYRLMESLTALRTRLTGVAHGDQAIAVCARDFRAAGGFPGVPLMEEYELRRRLKGPLILLPGAVRTSARRYERRGPLRNNLRNLVILFLYYLGVPPRRLARLYL